MNENNPKVFLTHEQGDSLAEALDVFAKALREPRELRVRDFQDITNEVRHFQQSPTPHRRLAFRLNCGRDVLVEEIRITPSTLGYTLPEARMPFAPI